MLCTALQGRDRPSQGAGFSPSQGRRRPSPASGAWTDVFQESCPTLTVAFLSIELGVREVQKVSLVLQGKLETVCTA